MTRKLIYVFVLFLLYSCNWDDCADEVNATNEKYDNLIKQVRSASPENLEKIKSLNRERGALLNDIDC